MNDAAFKCLRKSRFLNNNPSRSKRIDALALSLKASVRLSLTLTQECPSLPPWMLTGELKTVQPHTGAVWSTSPGVDDDRRFINKP
ncbi:uncharacterized protein V6R79_008323 [Siganus canaliculatus]